MTIPRQDTMLKVLRVLSDFDNNDPLEAFKKGLKDLIELYILGFEEWATEVEAVLDGQAVASKEDQISVLLNKWYAEEKSFYKQYKNLKEKLDVKLQLAEERQILQEQLTNLESELEGFVKRANTIGDKLRESAGSNFKSLPSVMQRRIIGFEKMNLAQVKRDFNSWIKQNLPQAP